MSNDFTLEELKEQFCVWHCTKKLATIEFPYQPVTVEVNGETVYEDESSSDAKINMCEYCPINDFLYFVRR